ncbi:MAG: protein jag [Spirochaetaceae bacterium]|nr:MAG: protein jag [Spirochaetaceae bacterium]
MTREFEGKTEKEAIDNAVAELGLERDEFDIEVVDTQKTGFLNLKKSVKIRVHLTDKFTAVHNADPENDFEHGIIDFVRTVTEMMGFPANSKIIYREPGKIGIRLDSQHSGILIGRKGKNLDALQLLVNVVAGRLDGSTKVVIDSENYRSRREEQLIRMAQKVGDEVKRSRSSRLLEPMNPFERRLIHKTLNDIEDIATKSEGDGLYKQVRIYYKGVGQT